MESFTIEGSREGTWKKLLDAALDDPGDQDVRAAILRIVDAATWPDEPNEDDHVRTIVLVTDGREEGGSGNSRVMVDAFVTPARRG